MKVSLFRKHVFRILDFKMFQEIFETAQSDSFRAGQKLQLTGEDLYTGPVTNKKKCCKLKNNLSIDQSFQVLESIE